MQNVPNTGPLPQGGYTIGTQYNNPRTGPGRDAMMRLFRLVIVGGSVLVAARFAAAARHEPPEIPTVANTPSTLKQSPAATALILGSVSVHLEETTLGSIVQSVGVGRVERKGDAGDSTSWLCYSLPHGVRLWLVSGELGGQDRFITSWHIRRRYGNANASCPKLGTGLRLAAPGLQNIWIGAPASRLEMTLETPSALNAGWRVYSYSGQAAKEGFKQLTIFGVHMQSGRIDQLFASQATTN